MKTKLLFLLLFVFFQAQSQTPNDSCLNAPILQVDTEYTINNLNTNQYGAGAPIQGHSANGNNVLGFWLKVQVPSGYYAENIEIYDVSNNFNPVIGLKSNCSYAYYPNIGGNDYADDNGYGGDEIFHTGLTGPDSIGDGIYHIRIYHYNNNETPPTVDFKIKITDNSSASTEADLSVHSLSIDPTTAIVGENVDLFTEIINLGEEDVTDDVTIRYTINGAEIDDDDINGSDLPLSQGDIDSEYENNYVFTNAGTYQYCVTIDNHPQETNYSNNSMCITIVVQDNSNCDEITITQQPTTSQDITTGNSASFSVLATGTAPITYQWKKNGTNISGATNNNYTTPALNLADNGNVYHCEITNCDGTKNSNNAIVTVSGGCVGVDISQHPQNEIKTVGETATFSVSTTGTSPFTYQWIKNGVNISGANNSSYSTAPLNLTDNGNTYSCFLSNCNDNNSETSNSATLTVTNNAPSELTVETINSTFPNSKILFSGTSNPNFIKVCADGTKSTRFTLVNNSSVSNDNIGFRVTPNNSDVSEYGTFATEDINPNGANNTPVALYTHATTFPNSADFNASRSIEIYDKNNPSNILFTVPLRIYKTPILMVHGLWGNASGFQEMENHLLNVGYNTSITRKLNYCNHAGNSFAQNNWVIPYGITNLLNSNRQNDYSVGKVDIVAHSMGGILTRVYLQSQTIQYRDNINKIITLNSPHSGSPIGNLITNSVIIPLTPILQDTFDLFNAFPCDGNLTDGAVYDLAIDSGPMIQLNQSNLNNNIVPSHTVTTTTNTVLADPLLDIIVSICAPELNVSANVFVNDLFDGTSHDGVVSTLSQKGGLTNNSTQAMSGQIKHIGAQEKAVVINHVSFLLQQNPSSSYFEQNGFSPTDITANYRTNPLGNRTSENSSELIPNSIFINTPVDDSVFNVGETTNVNITSTNGINRIIFYAIDDLNEDYFKEEFQSSQVDTQYTVSNDTHEDISFMALGFNDNGLVDYEIKTISVNSNITETGIEFSNSEIHIQKDFIAPISINVVYSNGDRRLLIDLSNVQLTINDNNIAEQFQSNMLKGNNLGSTTLDASYSGYSISTPVVVYESNVEMPDLSTLTNTDFEIPILYEDFLIYPNPNNGQFAIKLNSHPNEKIKIIVYNSIGQKISTFEDERTDENSTKSISLKGLNSGIYYVKVFFGTDSKTGKIVIE
jgi:pimeloyl-ACP methyl ester carboxylesterase